MDIKMPIDISCEEMVSNHCTFCGWLRKERVIKLLNWRMIYCVLFDQCFYYFKKDSSKKASGKFPLYGFNKVKRNIHDSVKWSFILEPIHPNQKSYTFSASSQQEMVEWMKYIKEEMLRANNKGQRTIADGASDESVPICDQDCLERIEERIYDDINSFEPVHLPKWGSDDSDLDKDDTEAEDLDRLKRQDNRNASTSQGRIGVLHNTFEIRRKPAGAQVPLTPNMPRRSPGTGRPNPRSYGYEHVDNVAGTPALASAIPRHAPIKDYWKSIFYHGNTGDATKLIEDIAKDGVFLVRKSECKDAPWVLVTYSVKQKKVKKFRIFMKNEHSTAAYYLKKELSFETIEELIYHYMKDSITKDDDFKLTVPYEFV